MKLKRFKDYFIEPLAYFFWILKGRKAGDHLGDWLAAERAINFLILTSLVGLVVFAWLKLGARYFLLCTFLVVTTFFKRKKYVADVFLILIFIVAIATPLNVLQREIGVWNGLLKQKLGEMKSASKNGVEFFPPTATTSEKPSAEQPSLHKETKSLIQNGDFQDLFGAKPLGWGDGLYSDRFKSIYGAAPFWINFLNVDIQVSIESTPKGNALKISHISKTQDHSVGVMEQRIDATPGIYRLTFLAKAQNDFEPGGLQFFTTDNWRIKDESKPNINRGFEVEKAGPFDWQQFSGIIQIDEAGKRTFSVVSAKKGTIWITDLSFVRIGDLKSTATASN